MFVRFLVDAAFTATLTIFFQVAMIMYSSTFNEAKTKYVAASMTEAEREQALKDLESAASALNSAMYVSFIHLLFPFNYVMEWYFARQTKRKQGELDFNTLIECTLFVVELCWIFAWSDMHGNKNYENNEYASPDMNDNQLYTINIIWSIQRSPIGF